MAAVMTDDRKSGPHTYGVGDVPVEQGGTRTIRVAGRIPAE